VIILDTHIWVWWIHREPRLTDRMREQIQAHEADGLGVSIFSCWEVAKLVEIKKLSLHCPLEEWLDTALAYPGIQLLDLSKEIIVESTRLPGEFHRDPADQIIVATARIHDCPLLTADSKILHYPHVKLL
jgi:PIN domain nuclease of toxin-antitoxin system